MKTTALLFLLIFFTSFVFSNSRSEEVIPPNNNPPSITEVIEKYIQACGGSSLSEIKTEVKKGTLLRGVSGQIPLEVYAKKPGQWVYNQVFAWGDQISYGFDGTSAWVVDTKGCESMTPRQRLDLQLMLNIEAPLRLTEFYPDMQVKGIEKVGDREMVSVTAKSPEGFSSKFTFDRETGLLQSAGDISFEDYRSVGQVKRPFKILLGENQGESHLQMIMQFSEIQHNIDVADSLFQKPECVLPFKEPPLYTKRVQVEVSIPALDACTGVYQHPKDSTVTYTVTRLENHLMIKRTGWGTSYEIIPESETDYFMRFLNQEFHFIKDATGRATRLEMGADRAIKAEKIE
ncbi:MAG: hypothetical protein OEV55_06015 [candidate division Zixibacteria bacterium]|nr:hypothetical protein [candidate division Zixibacteria bacterium]